MFRLAYFRAVSQLLWPDKDREEWFSLGENHEKAFRFPGFPARGTHRGQSCQPTTMRRYFENASAFQGDSDRTGGPQGCDPTNSEKRLYMVTPKVPARWGRRSVQSRH